MGTNFRRPEKKRGARCQEGLLETRVEAPSQQGRKSEFVQRNSRCVDDSSEKFVIIVMYEMMTEEEEDAVKDAVPDLRLYVFPNISIFGVLVCP